MTEMTSSSNLSFESNAVKFINSKNLAVSGNGPRGILQILTTGTTKESDNCFFNNRSEIKFPTGVVNDIELCGVPSQARSCIAVSNRDISTNQSYIGIVDLETPLYKVKLSSTIQSGNPFNSNYSSLSFYLHQMSLAAGTEIGDVSVWDIVTEKETNSFCADACGVNKVLYNRSGQLITVGCSAESQLRLWDSRYAQNSMSTSIVKSCVHPKTATSSSYGKRLFFTLYTCVQIHNSLPIVYCGTNHGDIVEWDLRYDSKTPTAICSVHDDEVTALLCHPFEENSIISSSRDGTVRLNKLNRNNDYSDVHKESNDIIIAEPNPSSITSMDCNVNGVLVASSVLGVLLSHQL